MWPGLCMVHWGDYHSGQRLDSLVRFLALRHHDGRVGGSITGLGKFDTVTCRKILLMYMRT